MLNPCKLNFEFIKNMSRHWIDQEFDSTIDDADNMYCGYHFE